MLLSSSPTKTKYKTSSTFNGLECYRASHGVIGPTLVAQYMNALYATHPNGTAFRQPLQ